MTNRGRRPGVHWMLAEGLVVACLLLPRLAVAQGLTGALIGTVKDEQGGVLAGAVVRISSPALIGGELTTKTGAKGHLRFPSGPPGSYALDIVLPGFRPYHDADIYIGAGATIERAPVLTLAALADSIDVHGPGSRLDARNPGFSTRFGAEDLGAIPMRRFSYQDWIKTAPGISPTSPSGSSVLVSAFGSGVDQNQYLLDGTSVTATGNGVSRADPGVDFIQELQIQSVGASVEYGNVQGAVVNVITKSGGDRFQYDAAYYWQTDALTSQPVRLEYDRPRHLDSGYERAEYRDFTTGLGGPVVRERLWFFSGYQHLRDSDSQPATDPDLPREYEQDKFFAKLTWRLAPGWQLGQSIHHEFWSNPETPSATKPRILWLRGPNERGGYQLDGRFGTLQEQALAALTNHAQIQSAPPQQLLDDLSSFQRVLFTNEGVRALSNAVREGDAILPDPDRRLTPLEQQGKAVFERACGQCHGGPGQSTPQATLNNPPAPVVRFHTILSQCPRPVDPGGRFVFAQCSPQLTRNARTYAIALSIDTPTPAGVLPAGTIVRRTSSDPGRALLTGFVGGPGFAGGLAPRDDWEKFDVPGLRGISRTAPYFHNNSAATLEEMLDHYDVFFRRSEVNFVPGPTAVVPPIATTDGVNFDRRPAPEERAALLAYLKKL